MKGAATLALVAAPHMSAGVEEFVRICVGIVAGGGGLALLEVGAGRGLLGGAPDLPDEVVRSLEGLAAFGVEPVPVGADELADLLRGCERVLRVAAPERVGMPQVLVLDDAYLERVDARTLLEALETAGQVLRA